MKNITKKGLIIILGSFLIVQGLVILILPSFKEKKVKAFETINLQLSDINKKEEINISNPPIVENVVEENTNLGSEQNEEPIVIPYIGTLEIPQINLKNGFVEKDSPYNNIQHAVTTLPSSSYPDVDKGNFILVAHSGTGPIAFFRNLYKLAVGDVAFVEYNNVRYQYKIVNIYYEAKTGSITIRRNYNKTTMTLITCTYQDDTKQTVYILELESQVPIN